ncbi:MAG TPA: tetratricopeptide repeat protein [Longimicrobiales bacterium]|nr:tetratricopeptide repeat protein [Longimicrobiales bacterium]
MMMWLSRLVLSAAVLLLLPIPGIAQGIKVATPLGDLEKAAVVDSTDAVAHYNLAIGYWSKKRFDDAEAELDRVLVLEPRFALAYLAKAYLPFARRPKLWGELERDKLTVEQRNQLDAMDRNYRQAFFFDPLVDLRIIGATLPGKSYLWTTDPYLSSIWDTWVRGFEDFRDGDYANAFRRFERMIDLYTSTGRRDPSRVPEDIIWFQGLAAARLGMHHVALRNARTVLDRRIKAEREAEKKNELTFAPLRSNDYRYVLGFLHTRAEQSDEAVRHFQEALTQDAGLYMAHVQLANIYESRGQLAVALAERRSAVAVNPEDPTSAIELAITLARYGESGEAEATLAETARTNPQNARAHYLLGIVRQQLGKPAEARASYQQFLAVVPSRYTREIEDARSRLAELP